MAVFKSFKSIDDVKTHLQGLQSLSELSPKDYALEGGIADTISRESKEMNFTQIRKFFGHIKKIDTEIRGSKPEDDIDLSKLYLLMPELAYGVGRKVIDRKFYDVMNVCLASGKIKKVKDFKRLVDLLTAVIAYSKMRGK